MRRHLLHLRDSLSSRPMSLLAGLLVVYICMALLYHSSTPFAIKPDEVWHLSYAEYLKKNRSLPIVDIHTRGFGSRPSWELEGHQPPLYYALVALLTPYDDLDDIDLVFARNPYFLTTIQGNRNPSVPLPGGASPTFFTGRYLSLVFGACALVATFGLARTFASSTVALLAIGFTAFNPMFLFMSTSFSNDMFVVAICSLALWLTATCIGRPMTLWRATLLGVLIGMAALVKLSGFVLLMVLPLAILLDHLIWHRHTQPTRRVVGYLALLLIVACLIPLPWFLRNWQLYGDPFATNALKILMGDRRRGITVSSLVRILAFLWKGYWLDFSPGGILFGPSWFYWSYGIWLAIAMIGLAAVWRNLKTERPYLVLCLLWILVYFSALLFTMSQTKSPLGGGRLLFPVSGALSILVALGVLCLWPRHWQRWVAALALALSIFFAVFAWASVLRPTFTVPKMDLDDAASLPNRSSYRFGDSIVLDGWTVENRNAVLGDIIPVTLYWHTSKPIKENYSVFLQLWPLGEGFEGALVGLDSYPGLGIYPTSRWPEDKILVDEYPIVATATDGIEEPIGAELIAGMYDFDTGERLTITVDNQLVGDHVTLGRVTLRPEVATPMPELARLAKPVHFATGLQLVGWEDNTADTDAPCVILWWQGADGPREDLTVFVHGLDEGGQLATQADGSPVSGRFPTSLWTAQDIVRDEHCFQQPENTNISGWAIGLYEPTTMERLPAYQSENASRMPQDAVILSLEP